MKNKILNPLVWCALFACIMTLAIAQSDIVPQPAAVASKPFDVWPILNGAVTVIMTIVAGWKTSKLSTSKRALIAVIKGVEFATSLPAVQAVEQTIKQRITVEANALGVQEDLHKIVTNVTAQ